VWLEKLHTPFLVALSERMDLRTRPRLGGFTYPGSENDRSLSNQLVGFRRFFFEAEQCSSAIVTAHIWKGCLARFDHMSQIGQKQRSRVAGGTYALTYHPAEAARNWVYISSIIARTSSLDRLRRINARASVMGISLSEDAMTTI